MAGKYRALLIGNSTYPADEHNLQTLKGPVKDIAAVNRALIDSATGLFDDVDVTLLPEATSIRALRTLSKFFGSADRDDVLLVYFSGHGKLDQNGRLHLCMQDTESTDLLSTAVSSTRINEFAEASRARNVVIVLDCCHAGAFRGGDFGDAVAGPGRYVLSSCRGTQLANDATVDNGTSYFTQHLVDGLLGEAADRDHDGFVDFSDLYAYIDRRLRADGKQIPQRRVDGDGDLRLAKRPAVASADAGAGRPGEAAASFPAADSPGAQRLARPAAAPTDIATPATGSRRTRRRTMITALAACAVIAGAVGAAMLLRSGGGPARPASAGARTTPASGNSTPSRPSATASGPTAPASPGHGSYPAPGPWRIRIDAAAYGYGCYVTLTNTSTGELFPLPGNLYETAQYQIPQAGKFRWTTTDRSCLVRQLPGMGKQKLPFTQDEEGDTDLFTAPSKGVKVHIVKNKESSCTLKLFNSRGQELDRFPWNPGDPKDVVLDPHGTKSVYVSDDVCIISLAGAA